MTYPPRACAWRINAKLLGARFQNLVTRMRGPLTCALAEFFGTALAVFLGDCTSLSLALTAEESHSSVLFVAEYCAWGLAFMTANFLVVHISGAHLNPALSIAYSVSRNLSIAKCVVFIVSQFFGGLLGATLALSFYYNAIACANLDLKMLAGSLFASPSSGLAPVSAFFAEFAATFVLAVMVCALAKDQHRDLGVDMSSIKIGLANILVMLAFGHQTGPTLNPARDNGPRIVAFVVGVAGVFDDGFWWYGAWLAPVTAAVLAVLLHDKLLIRRSIDAAEDKHLPTVEPPQQQTLQQEWKEADAQGPSSP